jgi:glutathione S-transferase
VRTPPEKRNLAEIEESRKRLAANFLIVDDRLGRRDYVAGDKLTIGDIPMGVAAHRWFNLPIERPALSNLAHWYRRLCQRPAFQEHCMLPLT